MKRNQTLHVVLAGIGCASLLVYVLACSTSFSPDDSQVLYPAFDKDSGAVSVAVYHRKTGRSENIFTAVAPAESATNRDLLLTRAQWLPDGKHVLIAHVPPDYDKGLSFFVVPRGVNEPVRHLANLQLDEPMPTLQFPFCIVGTKVLLAGGDESLVSLDFMTGKTTCRTNVKVYPWPAPGSKAVIGFAEVATTNEDEEGQGAFVTIDPQTLEFTPLITFTNKFVEGVFPTYDARGRRAILVSGEEDNLTLQVLKEGGVQFSRPLARAGARLTVGPWLDLGPRKDRVFTAYISQAEGSEDAEYGVVEIPFNREPLRWIPLFRAEPDDDQDLIFAQASLSNDGQTWAIATSYLYLQNESLKPADCALFLVEVGQAKPKITKVPIAPPAERRKLVSK